ncbi:TPA: hypothetical protein ACKRFF_001339 [Providencia stuartii]|uniref:hypothetical protein n=1 Tax=Providencia stuartii TaxID=588 RepID=UPI00197D3FE4|nr:hypothetical protein [Providencia stuartii]MBN5557383.1 hypothetical protein [Providencia stuartii]HEM8264927.1 hypothetical protein [Providencia stuartii]HEM8266928.1 hypothetical protein [Providencia stuartii]HEM8284928.1 hypothetical protein [Providencia stuartii]HEM8286894.1 hypothetical protein [Providencia stuartii]
MSAEITIHQAAVKAQQVEMINLLIESYPHKMQDSEISALATLMAGLSGDVALFLINEIEKRATK